MRFWIAVDVDLPSNPKTHLLASQIDRDVPHTVGLLVSLWGQVARHRAGGQVGDIPDTLLEDWAGWRGAASLFADRFRALYVDSDGTIHDWHEHQGKLLERKEKDRARKRKGESKPTSKEPPRKFQAGSSVTTPHHTLPHQEDVFVVKGAEPDNFSEDDVLRASMLWCAALNGGMADNTAIASSGFQPVSARVSLDTTREWLRLRIPPTTISDFLYQAGRTFKPRPKNAQIGSLRYLDSQIRGLQTLPEEPEAPLSALTMSEEEVAP